MSRPFPKRFFLALLASSFAASAGAGDPEHVAALVKGGATQLAQRLLDAEQKSNLPAEEWVLWERQRFDVLRALRKWDDLAKRVQRLPEHVPAEFRHEALVLAAEARLAANDPDGARRFLRQLLWQEQVRGEAAAQARRLIIRSYTQEGQLADARAALLRYQQDYQAKSEPWQVLHAELLLQAGDARAALPVLAGLQSYEARLLRLTAILLAKQQPARDVLAATNKLAAALESRPELRRSVWILAAEAAREAGDDGAQVLALEQALSLPEGEPQPLFRVTADDLWQTYDRLAERGGNIARLLVGNDDDWLEKAEAVACTEHHLARAWYAFLSRHAAQDEVRALSHRRLALGLMRDGRSHTLEALYTKSQRYPAASGVPEQVRYALADKAIADYNISLAAELVRGLDAPPEGEAPEDWGLRRARILIYAGDYAAAAKLLTEIMTAQDVLDVELTGRLLHVLFDFQAVDRHDDALKLFRAVYERTDSERIQREVLFWMADSHSALKRHADAAESYLRSATFNGASGEDPWGHTARFLAAEALGRAGLVDDARQVYLKLLASTPDPRRRAQIQRQMQQLWLRRKSASTR
jgi:hypothetical protein